MSSGLADGISGDFRLETGVGSDTGSIAITSGDADDTAGEIFISAGASKSSADGAPVSISAGASAAGKGAMCPFLPGLAFLPATL